MVWVQFWLITTPLLHSVLFSGHCATAFRSTTTSCLAANYYPYASTLSNVNVNVNGKSSGQNEDSFSFSEDLVQSLDLRPLMEAVSLHAGTRRGRQSLLALVNADYVEPPLSSTRSYQEEKEMATTSKARRLRNSMQQSSSSRSSPWDKSPKAANSKRQYTSFIAKTDIEARQEYALVSEATTLLRMSTNDSYPPLYGPDSSPYDRTAVETDYDTWLDVPAEDWSLEYILQAEQVLETIRKVKEWAESENIARMAPSLAAIGQKIEYDLVLAPVQESISGTVEIKRVRTVMDPTGKKSFSFQLGGEKFHVIQVLRQKVQDQEDKVAKVSNKKQQQSSSEQELDRLQEQLEAAEDEILSSLAQTVKAVSGEIDASLNVLARLDTLFARAAFGESINAKIPTVHNEGCIDVKQFVHPVLSLAENSAISVVPIDLRLSSEEGQCALIISGPNGGGKTAAMKSFGLSAVLCKLGIPIPCDSSSRESSDTSPRVDFFRNIHVALGDQQSLVDGESTMMARLNACASVIENVCTANNIDDSSSLVLIDEIGGGTDPNAGGAIAQAILEKLLEVKSCRIVATTHVPRLKVLSFQSKQFGCATVLLEPLDGPVDQRTQRYQQPAFELLYDSIGDSYALGAASRCKPSLPSGILSRATQLMETAITSTTMVSSNDEEDRMDTNLDDDAAYLEVLTQSLQRQTQRAREARKIAEQHVDDSARCRQAMLSLASSYDRQFTLLEQRLEEAYGTLSQGDAESLEVVGVTLKELRVVKKQVKSQADLLKERGLKMLPDWYDLREGETVVIVSEGERNGVSAKVLSSEDLPDRALKLDDVAVLPSFSAWDDDTMMDGTTSAFENQDDEKRLVLKRSQLAIWDYESVWDDSDGTPQDTTTSVQDSKRRLNDVLSTLKTRSFRAASKTDEDTSSGTFSSSRERKAAKKSRPNSKQKQRKRR